MDGLGRTALHVALEYQQWEAVEAFLKHGASVDVFAAAGLGDAERVDWLLAKDPNLAQASQKDGVTPLFYAAWSGDAASARWLLAAGAAVSPRAKRWWACLTPLHLALQHQHREVVSELLARGADVNASLAEADSYWPTPLHVAARWGTREDVVRILDYGAAPNGGQRWPVRWTPAGWPGCCSRAKWNW